MQIIEKRVSELAPYENNPRKNDEAVPLVRASIESFGFKQPIVIDSNNVIVAGHTRLKAAIELGMETVPCVVADDLDDDQIKAYRLADNKVAEASCWDNVLTALELSGIDMDMEQFGFELPEEEKEEETKGDVKFTEVLGEENNYVILQFKNDIDWLQACFLLGIEQVMAFSTRKDGKLSKNMRRIGTGRVLDGAKVLADLLGEKL